MKKGKRTNKISSNKIKNQRSVAKDKHSSTKNKGKDYLKLVCWIIVPIIVAALLVLDALGIYIFNAQRLMVLGTGLLIILLPFFSEITVKNLSVKRNKA